MLVKDFCEHRDGTFPDMFYESLPKFCFDENCGYPMEISETLTQLHCSNPKCPSKIVQRLVAIANTIGVKDLGVSKATKFIEKYGITNPMYIFKYEPDVDGTLGDGVSMEVSNKIIDQFLARNKFTLAEYVKVSQLPFVQTSAVTLFGDYDTLEEAYDAIEAGGVDYIRQKLNIGKGAEDGDVSVRAIKIYETLMTYKDDLFNAISGVEIIKTKLEGLRKFKAVCSDEVGAPFKTKADFYATVNSTIPNVHVEFLGAVNKDIDYLVWAGADGSPARYTNKVKKVEDWNAKYEEHSASGTLKAGERHIPIVTAKQFIEILSK